MKMQITQLVPYAPITVEIRGKVQYSHITKKIEGKELADANERKIKNGGIAETTPYYALTLTDAYILNPDPAKYPQEVLQFFDEKLFSKTVNGAMTRVYYGKDKSQNPIALAYGAEAGTELAGQRIADKDAPLQNELAVGLDVTIGAKIYKITKGVAAGRAGLGIDYVIVNEPVRYYSGKSGIESALASQGVTYKKDEAVNAEGTVVTEADTVAQPSKTDVQPQSVSPMVNPVQNQQPMQQPQYGQVQQGAMQAPPQGQFVQNQYSQVPAQAQAQQAQAAANPMVSGVYPQGGANPQVGNAGVAGATPGLVYNPNN